MRACCKGGRARLCPAPNKSSEKKPKTSRVFRTSAPWLLVHIAAISLPLLLPLKTRALDYCPWYSEPLLPMATLAYQFQTFPRVQTDDGTLNQREHAHTGRGTLSFSPTDRFNGQAEAALTGTHQHHFFFDYVALSARYLFYNDIIGDPFSLGVGGTLFVPSTTSLRDFATPHLGPVDFEAHLAIGKEYSCSSYWFRRIWAVGAVIASIKGSPSLWAKLAIAFNRHDRVCIEGFLFGLLGLGTQNLSNTIPFNGYGTYATRAIDLGLQMASSWSVGTVRIEYRYRPLAHNYPQNAHFVIASILFPLAI